MIGQQRWYRANDSYYILRRLLAHFNHRLWIIASNNSTRVIAEEGRLPIDNTWREKYNATFSVACGSGA